MKKETLKEENIEKNVSENYSFNQEELKQKDEYFTSFTEDNTRSKEDNVFPFEENVINKSKKIEKIQKASKTASKGIQTIFVGASSVAVLVGGVMIYNESILPPSHVEILETWTEDNFISVYVYASNLSLEESDGYVEDSVEECDLTIEVTGGGEIFSQLILETGFSEFSFPDLKYETEYEIAIYQNVILGFNRPLLASTKITTGTPEEYEIIDPIFNGVSFRKDIYDSYQELSYEIDLIDEGYYLFDFVLEILDEQGGNLITTVNVDRDFYGILDISREFTTKSLYVEFSCTSTNPHDLNDGEYSTTIILYSDFVDFSAIEENDYRSTSGMVNDVRLIKFTEEEMSDIRCIVDYEDPNYEWFNFVAIIKPIDSEEVYTSNLIEPAEENILDIPPDIMDSVVSFSIQVDILISEGPTGDGEFTSIIVYDTIVDLSNIEHVNFDEDPSFYSVFLEKNLETAATGVPSLSVTLNYVDSNSYWTDFVIEFDENEDIIFSTNLVGESGIPETLEFNIEEYTGIYKVIVRANSTNPLDIEGSGEDSLNIVLYNEEIDFSNL